MNAPLYIFRPQPLRTGGTPDEFAPHARFPRDSAPKSLGSARVGLGVGVGRICCRQAGHASKQVHPVQPRR